VSGGTFGGITDLTVEPWSAYGAGAGSTWQVSVSQPVYVLVTDQRESEAALSSFTGLLPALEGSAADALNDHEWFYASDVLYYRDDSGTPASSGIQIYRGDGNYAGGADGGAIMCNVAPDSGQTTYENLMLIANRSATQGGAICNNNRAGDALLDNITAQYNVSYDAALKFSNGAEGDVQYCIVERNRAVDPTDTYGTYGGIDFGGNSSVCTAADYQSSTMSWTVVAYNVAQNQCGGVGSLECHDLAIYDSTIVGNVVTDAAGHGQQAKHAGFDYGGNDADVTYTNTIVWGDVGYDSGEIVYGTGGGDLILNFSYSDVRGGAAGITGEDSLSNMQTSTSIPLNDDYTLKCGAAGQDTGTDAHFSGAVADLTGEMVTDGSGGALDSGIDMGAYEIMSCGNAAALLMFF
jgi:hypothetical protein